MKRLFLLIGLICIALLQQNAQIISNVDWTQKGQQIEISYNLASITPGQIFNVTIYVSTDGGTTFTEKPLKLVAGDVGKKVTAGMNKKIIWDVLKEMPDFGGIVVFDIRAFVMKEKVERRFFLGYKGSFSTRSFTAPFGLVAGVSGKTGFYVSTRFNSDFFAKISDNYDLPQGWSWVQDIYKIQRLSITAGAQLQVQSKMHIYAGAGFTKYNLFWQAKQNTFTQWRKISDKSFNSYEVEAGIMFQLKHMFFSPGVTLYNNKYSDITISAGIVF